MRQRKRFSGLPWERQAPAWQFGGLCGRCDAKLELGAPRGKQPGSKTEFVGVALQQLLRKCRRRSVFPGSAKLQLGNSGGSADAAMPSWSLALPGGKQPGSRTEFVEVALQQLLRKCRRRSVFPGSAKLQLGNSGGSTDAAMPSRRAPRRQRVQAKRLPGKMSLLPPRVLRRQDLGSQRVDLRPCLVGGRKRGAKARHMSQRQLVLLEHGRTLDHLGDHARFGRKMKR
ncbi:hypothetical protein ABIE13_003396 [Ottowia thiooxydans]|uniref:Uncharacterized protein n=1 Tax=Ottowia thiooxydans TaxID=219182 RepID=A0ABV2QCC6_9BURK